MSQESDKALSESKFFHYIAMGMGAILLSLIGWIGINVAHIPVIDEEIHDLRGIIENIVDKELSDHEARLRNLEKNNQ